MILLRLAFSFFTFALGQSCVLTWLPLLAYQQMLTYWIGSTNVQNLETIPDQSETLLADTSSVNLNVDESDSDSDDDNDEEDGHHGEDMSSHHTKETEVSSASGSQPDYCLDDEQLERKINVISDLLLGLLKRIVAGRPKDKATRSPLDDQVIKALEKYLGTDKLPLEEASEFINVSQAGSQNSCDVNSIALSGDVQSQMHDFVSIIAKRHNNNNPFVSRLHAHCFFLLEVCLVIYSHFISFDTLPEILLGESSPHLTTARI